MIVLFTSDGARGEIRAAHTWRRFVLACKIDADDAPARRDRDRFLSSIEFDPVPEPRGSA